MLIGRKKMTQKTDEIKTLLDSYRFMKDKVVSSGYTEEIKWQEYTESNTVKESQFLEEAAWVVLSSGFKESILRKKFKNISLCFCNWASAQEISEEASVVRNCALHVFGNTKKIDSILKIAAIIAETGFDDYWGNVCKNPIDELQKLPFIGKITSYHLAKNLGFDVAKPDRHLLRIANLFGFEDNVYELCKSISNATGDKIGVVDIVIWRYATIDTNYLETLKIVLEEKFNSKKPDKGARFAI